MSSKSRTAALVTIALLLGPRPLLGQTRTPATDDRTPGWIFTPAMGFGGFWDDNVLLQHPAGEKPGDYASPISPSLSLDFTGRRTSFSTGYEGSVVLHRTLEELNSYHQSLRVRAEHKATKRLLFLAEDMFAAAPTTDALQLGGVPFYRIGSRSNSARGGIEALLSVGTTLRATYGLTFVTFDKDELQLQDLRGGNAHEVMVVLDRAVSKVFSIGGEYSFLRAFVHGGSSNVAGTPESPPVFPDDRFNIQSGIVTASYQLTPIWTVSGGAGVSYSGDSLLQDSRTGPTLRAGFVRRGRRSVVTGQYSRSYIPAFGFGGTSQNEELSGTVRVPLARNRMWVQASASLLDNDGAEPGQPSLRSMWIDGRVGYFITRWLRIEGFYARADQDSHVDGGRRYRNTLGFQIVTSRPFKLQ